VLKVQLTVTEVPLFSFRGDYRGLLVPDPTWARVKGIVKKMSLPPEGIGIEFRPEGRQEPMRRLGKIDTWTFDKNTPHARLNGGKTAEVKLKRFQGRRTTPRC